MSSWAYGLVEIQKGKDNELTVCEVYFDKKAKPMMFTPIEWKEVKNKDVKKMITDDILSQFKHNIRLKAKQDMAGNWRIRK